VSRLRQSRISGLDTGAVPVVSTNFVGTYSFIGDELGSTDVVKTKLRDRRASGLNRKITTTANDNFAMDELPIAA